LCYNLRHQHTNSEIQRKKGEVMAKVEELFEQFKKLDTDAQRRLVNEILDSIQYLTDGQVCALLQIDQATLRRWLNEGPPQSKPEAIDIRLAQPVLVGGQRRWDRGKLMGLLQ
jgi:transcriptional regulator with GAF, ATPase, and Fis domain